MTPSRQTTALQVLDATHRQLRIRTALTLQARQHGWLRVASGRVWVTRSGDARDHVLAAGQAIALARGQHWVAEPWQTGSVVQLHWAAGAAASATVSAAQAPGLRPVRAAARPVAAGLVWRTLAWGLRGVAVRLAAAARRAESRASTAQGRICAGDAIAASGALR